MRWRLLIPVLFSCALALTWIYLPSPELEPEMAPVSTEASTPPSNQRPSGPDYQRVFFADWHRPYGAVLEHSVRSSIQEELDALPKEDHGRAVNSWIQVGPSGMINNDGGQHSGRVLDLDALSGPGLAIASASGGLWQYNGLIPLSLTDEVTSQWIGSVAINPDNPDIMLIGTGEYRIYGGTGLWKSTDGGNTWINKPMDSTPSGFFRIRYGSDRNNVHAATTGGYYRSEDGGETWTRTYSAARVTDLMVVPAHAGGADDVVYFTAWGRGVYMSMDHGVTWLPVDNPTIPTGATARGAITFCESDPGVMYAAFSQAVEVSPDKYQYPMLGIWKTTNFGYSWQDVSPPDNYMSRQGWYNNVISVCPTDPNLVYAGGVSLLRSLDGGANWTTINDPNLHVDYHAMQWHPNGLYFWVGHDGGFSHSNNQGMDGSWSSATNYLPITQYTEFDVRGISWSSAMVCGGSQDNGISVTQDGGSSWEMRASGDGGGIQIGPDHMWEVYFAMGIFNNGWTFQQYYSGDACQTNIQITDGLEPSDNWYPPIRLSGDGTIFTYSGGFIHSRTSPSGSWQQENASAFSGITEMTVSPTSGTPCIYICRNNTHPWQLYCKDGDWWYSRGHDLPAGQLVRKVVPHPTDRDQAYALINGLGSPGQKLYHTSNRGVNWTNITGTMPNIPLADLVVDPDNNDHLYVGTAYGFFRSQDGGGHWERWNNGCPDYVVVTEMKPVDMRYFNQGFHIAAATYGRSIWRRNIDGDDPTSVPGRPTDRLISVQKAVPNPFNPQTSVHFDLKREASVEIAVFDLAGRQVRRLLSEQRSTGPNTVSWNGRDDQGQTVGAGTYLVRVEAEGVISTLKVVLAK